MTQPGRANYLFVPFTDLTNGHGSYGGRRYLGRRVPAASSRTTQLDFNRAYSVAYFCPVPPAENRLSVAIPAGVQSDH